MMQLWQPESLGSWQSLSQ